MAPAKPKPVTKPVTEQPSLLKSIKDFYKGARFVCSTTYKSGYLPYMLGTYCNSALLGMTAGITIKLNKKLIKAVNSKHEIPNTTAIGFFTSATIILIRVVYMNAITAISKVFSGDMWANTIEVLKTPISNNVKEGKKIQNLREQSTHKANLSKVCNSAVSDTEKFIGATHNLFQSIIQSAVAIFFSCQAISETPTQIMYITIGSTILLLATGIYIQFNNALPTAAEYKQTKNTLQNKLPDDGLDKIRIQCETLVTNNNEKQWIGFLGQTIYRFMTDAAESVMSFIILAYYIPKFPLPEKIGGNIAASTFTASIFLATTKAIGGLFKDASAVIRSSDSISEVGSSYNQVAKLTETKKDNVSEPNQEVENKFLDFVDKNAKETAYIIKYAFENTVIACALAASFCLYFDSMLYFKLFEYTPYLAHSLYEVAKYAAITVIATASFLFLKNHIEKKPNPEQSGGTTSLLNYFKLYNNGITLFSISSSVFTSYLLVNNLAESIWSSKMLLTHLALNPMAKFSLLLIVITPIMSLIANYCLIPSIKTVNKNTANSVHSNKVVKNKVTQYSSNEWSLSNLNRFKNSIFNKLPNLDLTQLGLK